MPAEHQRLFKYPLIIAQGELGKIVVVVNRWSTPRSPHIGNGSAEGLFRVTCLDILSQVSQRVVIRKPFRLVTCSAPEIGPRDNLDLLLIRQLIPSPINPHAFAMLETDLDRPVFTAALVPSFFVHLSEMVDKRVANRKWGSFTGSGRIGVAAVSILGYRRIKAFMRSKGVAFKFSVGAW